MKHIFERPILATFTVVCFLGMMAGTMFMTSL